MELWPCTVGLHADEYYDRDYEEVFCIHGGRFGGWKLESGMDLSKPLSERHMTFLDSSDRTRQKVLEWIISRDFQLDFSRLHW